MLNADLIEFDFDSDFDGLNIKGVMAMPSGKVNGVVQIVHGMCEYKERYFDFIDYLAGEGFICVIHDNRGHGQSVCSQEDLGFLYKNGGEGYVADIALVSRMIGEGFPGVPHFLFGHSMGSLGARCFLKEHDAEINGLIVCGCPCIGRFSPFARNVESALSKKLGSRFRSDKIDGLIQEILSRDLPKDAPPHSWICAKAEVVEKFNNDPLCNYIYTLNGYEALLYLFRETYTKKGYKVANPDLPVRFISGKEDPCMMSEKQFFRALDLMESIGYEKISHRLFDGMRHEILNEENNMTVYKDVAKTLFSWTDLMWNE